METIFKYLRGFGSLIAGAIGFCIGNGTPMLYALLAFMVIDYITGVICAASKHELSSAIGAKGIFKKVIIVLIVSIAHIVDAVIIKEGDTMQSMTAFFYIANEGISILENAAWLGLPIPNALQKILLQLKKDEEDAGTLVKSDKKTK